MIANNSEDKMGIMYEEEKGFSTGFQAVNDILGGLPKTDVIMLAGRPGVGKTSTALNVAKHAASMGKKVMVFSIEQAKPQLEERVFSMMSNVPIENIRKGNISMEERKRLSAAQDHFNSLDIIIDESSVTPAEMMKKCSDFKQKRGGLDLVIIDYLQLMIMGGYRIDQREKEISAIMKSIKDMANELDCVVILLSTISRDQEQRYDDHKDKLSDLIYSGAIEQDTYAAILLDVDSNAFTKNCNNYLDSYDKIVIPS